MSTTGRDSWHIAAARPEEQSAAFELALRHVPDADRPTRVLNALTLLAAAELDPAGILVAHGPAGLIGTQVCVPLRGASGLCWLPKVVPEFETAGLAEALTRAGLDWLRAQGARFAQALVHPDLRNDAAPLCAAGFARITELIYLEHDLSEAPARARPDNMRFTSYTPACARVFHETLLASYEGSLDCPELNGLRSIEEIIDGHRAQGNWRPEQWRLAFLGAEPAGALLLTELPGGEGWDLSYLGVTPRFRGRGLGRALAAHALRAAHEAGALQLLVAVDARNTPARRLYEALHFHTAGMRDVYLAVFASGPTACAE